MEKTPEQTPLFSIIVPVYNSARYLPECLDSILRQSQGDFEIVCVNDGSTDDSLEILKKFSESEPRVKVWSQENQGQSSARNHALSKASGEYILFIDSDDVLMEDALKKITLLLEEDRVDLLYFDAETMFDDPGMEKEFSIFKSNYMRKSSLGKNIPGSELFLRFKKDDSYRVSVCLGAVKREHLIKNDIFFPEGILYEDNYFTLKCMLLASRASHSNEVFYRRRVRSDSTMTSKITFKNCMDYFDVWLLMCEFAINHRFSEEVEKAIGDETDHILEIWTRMFEKELAADTGLLNELPYYKRKVFSNITAEDGGTSRTYLAKELDEIKSSTAWRVGRAVTFFPRLIKKMYKKH